ncbi:hypothetical protein SAMN02745244_00835 [Tessaracoccus bendigoensis DSM 12906]|uniref:Transmembrane protein n=1 Tax=Tessaracoccus bendigoensis DSM 12906 TaxID=1123357 RepID=A0A1M6D4A9_9ACTN|nr:hypothetical protein [Tessaracoccus bendigoensis]SHI67951.1 hypothetical protein SAMN02745244_00835 [Tessaracoccus bendigoensis DSM 12906]
MNNLWLALQGAWQVLLVGLILGAGLPTIFALGIRALSYGVGADADATDHVPHPFAKVVAYSCFGIVVLAILLGIGTIVASGFGLDVVFDGITPRVVAK